MPRAACTFRKRDLKVALEAVQEAGAKLATVIVRQNGDIELQMQTEGLSKREERADTRGADQPGERGEPNPWDDVLKTRPS